MYRMIMNDMHQCCAPPPPPKKGGPATPLMTLQHSTVITMPELVCSGTHSKGSSQKFFVVPETNIIHWVGGGGGVRAKIASRPTLYIRHVHTCDFRRSA